MNKREAEALVGTLSKPSKMPGYAYGIPAKHCVLGSKLAKLPNTVCSKCYALKGRYVFPNVVAAQERRYASLRHPDWVDAITTLIAHTKTTYFRWHDSGDIQGLWHLNNIVKVAKLLPNVKFWLPTREKGFVSQWLVLNKAFPENLVVRVSGALIDGEPPKGFPHTSSVVSSDKHSCPAPSTDGQCKDCRACWSPDVASVSYRKH